jgi:hypothetical protein
VSDAIEVLTPSVGQLAAECSVDQLTEQSWGQPIGNLSVDATIYSLKVRVCTATGGAAEKEALFSDYRTICAMVPPTHPDRIHLSTMLGGYLEHVCYQPAAAVALLKESFDDAVAELDCLSESSYMASTIHMQSIRDTLVRLSVDDGDTATVSDSVSDGCDSNSEELMFEDVCGLQKCTALESEQDEGGTPPGSSTDSSEMDVSTFCTPATLRHSCGRCVRRRLEHLPPDAHTTPQLRQMRTKKTRASPSRRTHIHAHTDPPPSMYVCVCVCLVQPHDILPFVFFPINLHKQPSKIHDDENGSQPNVGTSSLFRYDA